MVGIPPKLPGMWMMALRRGADPVKDLLNLGGGWRG